MSFSALPTEIDKLIVELLDREELKSLCLTSKYYKDIAQPFLYNSISFRVDNHAGAYRLARTLLDRPELGASIKTLRVYHKPDTPNQTGFRPMYIESDDAKSDGENEKELSELGLVVNELGAVVKKQLQKQSKEYARLLEQKIDSAFPRLSKHYKKQWVQHFHEIWIDASVALIATLAPNLKVLDLLLTGYPGCSFLVTTILLSLEQRPFPKLKVVIIDAEVMPVEKGSLTFYVPYAARSEELRVRNLTLDHFEYPEPRAPDYSPPLYLFSPSTPPMRRMPNTFTPTLRVLELDRVSVEVNELAKNLQLGYFRNVQKLILRDLSHALFWL